jgi:hypothetical protein
VAAEERLVADEARARATSQAGEAARERVAELEAAEKRSEDQVGGVGGRRARVLPPNNNTASPGFSVRFCLDRTG